MIDYRLPVVDLHRHLDGNIRPSTMLQLARKHNLTLPADSVDSLRPFVQIQDRTSNLMAFLSRLDYGVSVLANLDACYRVAYENIEDVYRENLDYAELRFSPWYMAKAFSLPVEGVVEAVVAGVKAGIAAFGVRVNLVGILSRTFGSADCHKELQGLLSLRDDIVALDLAGDEGNYPAALFESHFKTARNAGWHVTVHAGEAAGPDSIWKAINTLGATRIGHGVSALKDQKLMAFLAEKQIGIESCPTSNYQTGTVIHTASHPLKQFLEAGIPVTLNTDDPGVSAITLNHEYTVAKDIVGLSREQLACIQHNGLNQAFIDDETRQRILSEKAASPDCASVTCSRQI